MNELLSLKTPRLLIAAISLLISFYLYAFYRSEQTVINILLSQTLPNHLYETLRHQVNLLLPLPDVLIGRIPAGFWILGSSLLSHDCVLILDQFELRLAWVPPLVALLIEIAQYFHLTDGTFDPWDVVTIAIAAFIATWSTKRLSSPAFPAPWNWCFGAACLVILFLADIKP